MFCINFNNSDYFSHCIKYYLLFCYGTYCDKIQNLQRLNSTYLSGCYPKGLN